jgi:hypothetical protein
MSVKIRCRNYLFIFALLTFVSRAEVQLSPRWKTIEAPALRLQLDDDRAGGTRSQSKETFQAGGQRFRRSAAVKLVFVQCFAGTHRRIFRSETNVT